MEVYGFKIEVSGGAIQSVSTLDGALLKLETEAKQVTSQIDTHFNRMSEKIKGHAGAVGGYLKGALGVGFLFGGMELAKSSIEAFEKREESIAKIGAVLKSTGSVAGQTADELERMAGSQSKKELFGKSAIMDAQSMLLTFVQVRGEIFEKAMPAIADFATRFKMELPEAANMVGKALNNPLTGMTRLQRQGVMFSDAQKQQIKDFMAVNNLAGAQGIILKELQTEFGGLAEAMTKTDHGQLKMAAKSLTEIKLTLGEIISKTIAAFAPAISRIGSLFHKVFGKDLSRQMEESRYEMNSLFEVLKSGNLPLEKRKELMAELNLKYADYLPNQLTEKTTAEELANAMTLANDEMLRKIQIQANQERYEKLFKDYQSTVDKITDEKLRQSRSDVAFEAAKQKAGLKTMWGESEFADAEKKRREDVAASQDRQLKDAKEKLDLGLKALDMTLGGRPIHETKRNPAFGNGSGSMGAGSNASTTNALSTSMLGGASGGLGEAKNIKIEFNAPMMKIDVPGGDGRDIVNKAPVTMEMLLRMINNLSMSQASTM